MAKTAHSTGEEKFLSLRILEKRPGDAYFLPEES